MSFALDIEKIRTVLKGTIKLRVAATPLTVNGVVLDSRKIRTGNLFIARKGEKLDGHDYLSEVFRSGAAGAVVDETWAESPAGKEGIAKIELQLSVAQSQGQLQGYSPGAAIVSVPDTTRALGDLARFWRANLNLPTLAVCGSNGKTTTKEMLRTMLAELVGKGVSSQKSFNNHVGLPATILEASYDDKYLILEAGMNHSGELDYLGSIAKPDVVLLLNIGPEHIEFFGTLERIADAECEILAHLSAKAKLVMNGSDSELADGVKRFEEKTSRRLKRITFGDNASSDYSASKIIPQALAGMSFQLNHKAESKDYAASIPQMGAHNVINATGAVAAVKTLFPALDLAAIIAALSSTVAAPMRLQIVELGKAVLINDAYNANPASMKAALATAKDLSGGGEIIAVLGDMFELGELAPKYHQELGRDAAQSGVARLYCIGNFAKTVTDSAKQAGLAQAFACSSVETASEQVVSAVSAETKVILVKGSRGMFLERFVELSTPLLSKKLSAC